VPFLESRGRCRLFRIVVVLVDGVDSRLPGATLLVDVVNSKEIRPNLGRKFQSINGHKF